MHVIIVGAGPCGLSLSLALAASNISSTTIDRDSTIDSRPRAVHLTAPGIKIFKRAGVLEDVQREGFLPKNWTFRRMDGSPIVTVEDIANKESPEATVVLPIGFLNEILLRHAEGNEKVELQWGSSVVGVGQDEKGAWAVVRNGEGGERRVEGDFVVGCDGGTSRVRKSLFGERSFPGKTWDVQFVATDVYYPFDNYGFDDVNVMVHPTQGHLVARLTKTGLWRVAYQEDKDMSFQDVLANHPAQYEKLLPGNPKPEDYKLTNISPYKLHQRCAEKFRVGRICLAGDAAHLCNPWGGLGLTGGFADVLGLVECFVGIEEGLFGGGGGLEADADGDEHWILGKWDEVRRGIFRDVIDPMSTANFERVSSLADEEVVERDPFVAMCRRAKGDRGVKEKMANSVYATCHDFTQYYDKKVPVTHGSAKVVTNGVTNGEINGLVDGATNGSAKRLTNGNGNGITNTSTKSTNGVTNGQPNGITKAVTNGITNGAFTNGVH